MALKKVRDSQIIQSISILLINMLLIFSLARTWGVEGATWAYNVAAVITVMMGYWLWIKVTGSLGGNNKIHKGFSTVWNSSVMGVTVPDSDNLVGYCCTWYLGE